MSVLRKFERTRSLNWAWLRVTVRGIKFNQQGIKESFSWQVLQYWRVHKS